MQQSSRLRLSTITPEAPCQHGSRNRNTCLIDRRVWYNSFDLGTQKLKARSCALSARPLRAAGIGVSKAMQLLTVRRVPLTLLGFIILAVSAMHAQTTVCGAQSDVGFDSVTDEGQDSADTSCRSASDVAEERPTNGAGGLLPGHVVCLSWNASTSRHVIGYNIYRRVNFGIRRKLNQRPIRSTHCTDRSVSPGYTYRYHVRAVDARGKESAPSNHAIVYIPR